MKPSLIDDHFYWNEPEFYENALRYDSYSRDIPIFCGEYACRSWTLVGNHFRAAMLEATAMCGMERNADIVRMATYAPLLVNRNGYNWLPGLIWFDNQDVLYTTSYFIQKMFANNRGDRVLRLTCAGKQVAGQDGQAGLFASAVATDSGSVIVKVVNTAKTPQMVTLQFSSPRSFASALCQILHSDEPYAENRFGTMPHICPTVKSLDLTHFDGLRHSVELLPESVNVVTFNH